MTDVCEKIHWFLLSLVSVSLVKSRHQWQFILHGQLIVVFVFSLVAFRQVAGYSVLPPVVPKYCAEATLGNFTSRALLLVISLLVAAGFLLCSLFPERPDASGNSFHG